MTAKPRIVQIGIFKGSPSANERLREQYDVLPLWESDDPIATLKAQAQDITAVVTSASMGCKADIIDAMPSLKAICSWGVGYDSIDTEAAAKRGVLVSNTPDVLSDCVADLAWGLLIAGARRMGQGERFVRAGGWGQVHGGIPLGRRVSGKKLGVIGLGRIGLAIAKRGTGFDMDVRYHNRRQRDDSPYVYEASLVELAKWADFLVVATVGGASTHHLVNAEVIRALGPTGIIVNIARGTVIDEAALVKALEAGELGGAALDVFEHEPKVPAELIASDNAVVLPHIGSATLETRKDMEDLMLENLASFFACGKVVTPV